MIKNLEKLYNPTGSERVGFVLEDGSIIEVANISSKPEESFMISTLDIMTFSEEATATWHTHPDAGCNLSGEDYLMIKNYPDLSHYILGNDGIICYKYDTHLQAVMEVDING